MHLCVHKDANNTITLKSTSNAFMLAHTHPKNNKSHMHTHTQVRARFVERFSMGAPFAGGEVKGPAIGDLQEKVSWVEKFVALGE